MILPGRHFRRTAGPGVADFDAWRLSAIRGNFADAWRINERTGQHWPSAHRFWSGADPRGRSLTVFFLHGLGDAVQMLQYAPLLAAVGVRASFEVQGPLTPLLPYFAAAQTVQADAGSLLIEAMELPFLFRTVPQHLPLAQRYLQLPPALLSQTDASMGVHTRPRVGLVWSGGDWDRDRWVPLDCLRPLCDNPELEIWNLQQHPGRQPGVFPRMRDASSICGEGVLALAATIANLDVLVTVDTLAAHLAGALGVPACLLLKHEADWRWMTGTGSPWYPSLKLIRQVKPGSWDNVIERLVRTLPGIVGLSPQPNLSPPAVSPALSR